MKKQLNSLQDTKKFAKEFSQIIFNDDQNRNVVLLQGDLGAGKTTFSQFLLEVLGAEGPFTSPTFVIMKKYELTNCSGGSITRNPVVESLEGVKIPKDVKPPKGNCKNIYHLDCYRVDEESVLDLGWEEIVADKNNLILVEWPERIKKIWPEKYWLLKFTYGDGNNERAVEVIEKQK